MLNVVDIPRLARAVFLPLPMDPEEYDGLKFLRFLWNNRDCNQTLTEIMNHFGEKNDSDGTFREMLIKFASLEVITSVKENGEEKFNLTKEFRDIITEEQRRYNEASRP